MIRVEHNGTTVSLGVLAKRTDVSYETLRKRYLLGRRDAELTAPAREPVDHQARWSQDFRYQGLL